MSIGGTLSIAHGALLVTNNFYRFELDSPPSKTVTAQRRCQEMSQLNMSSPKSPIYFCANFLMLIQLQLITTLFLSRPIIARI